MIKDLQAKQLKMKILISNKEFAEESQKPINRQFNNRKVHSSFINDIWGTYPGDMQLTSKSDKGFRFLLCALDIYSYMFLEDLIER